MLKVSYDITRFFLVSEEEVSLQDNNNNIGPEIHARALVGLRGMS
jgi:hypothetical protein